MIYECEVPFMHRIVHDLLVRIAGDDESGCRVASSSYHPGEQSKLLLDDLKTHHRQNNTVSSIDRWYVVSLLAAASSQ